MYPLSIVEYKIKAIFKGVPNLVQNINRDSLVCKYFFKIEHFVHIDVFLELSGKPNLVRYIKKRQFSL